MQPQLESTSAIEPTALIAGKSWFDYPTRVFPHHTDYSGVAWHGTYLAWMEEARVEYLRSLGFNYADLVALGYEMPLIELSIRYHRPVQMGAEILVRTRLSSFQGVRMVWEQRIQSPDEEMLYVTAQVTLVTTDREKGRIARQLPPAVETVLERLREER